MTTDQGGVGRAAELLGRRVGLRLDPGTRGRLARCLAEGASAADLSPDAYALRLESDTTALQDLLNRVTVQETAFFRDQAQFEALVEQVVPRLADPVCIWSAGAANGQEAYSLAMVLDESGRRDWRIIATDISTRAIERVRLARYSEAELRGLSEPRRRRYLRPVAGGHEVIPRLRERVVSARHNLIEDAPPFAPGQCAVIFCRNVLIYFRREDVIALLDRLARWLPERGLLFLGYSESLWRLSDRFQLTRLGGAFVYLRADRPPPAARVRSPAERHVARRDGGARPASAPAGSGEEVAELLAAGETASSAGDHAAAASAFRKAAYLDPDHPLTHFHLGVALEALGDTVAARRAYAAARSAVGRCDTASVEAALEGYRLADLSSILAAKLGEAP